MARFPLPLLLATVLAACPEGKGTVQTPQSSAPVPPPYGTVLRVNDRALATEDVDRFARPIAELEPQFQRIHQRRLALTNVVLPLVAVATLHPEAHARAAADGAAAARAGHEELLARSSELAGTFREIGLDLWCLARDLPAGEWSAPLELVGRFAIVRLDARAGVEEQEVLRGRWLEFPFVQGDLQACIEEALDASRLEIVDPAWRACVPESWQRRMNKP
jgi:hypothetical protein